MSITGLASQSAIQYIISFIVGTLYFIHVIKVALRPMERRSVEKFMLTLFPFCASLYSSCPPPHWDNCLPREIQTLVSGRFIPGEPEMVGGGVKKGGREGGGCWPRWVWALSDHL